MTRLFTSLRAWLVRLWHTDRALTATGLLMSIALVGFLAAIFLDPRTILGVPAWLKPAKFAASTTIYSLTLAWIFTFLPAWRRTRSIVGRVTAIVFIGEVAIIALQAWRGTTSHFNVSTPLDATLFAAMGTAIVAQTLTSIAVVVALWREPFVIGALGTALRAGMVIAILGASIAGTMTRPTDGQILELRTTGRTAHVGAHTVGALDGGRGLPVTGWSRDHGDLRIPHFVGLHALQVLPIIALVLQRRRFADREAVRTMRVVAASYATFVALLLVQALRAEPLFSPAGVTVVLFAAWAIVSAGALWLARRHPSASASARTFAGVLS